MKTRTSEEIRTMRAPGRRKGKPGPHSLDHIPTNSERRGLWKKRNKRRFRASKQDQPLAIAPVEFF